MNKQSSAIKEVFKIFMDVMEAGRTTEQSSLEHLLRHLLGGEYLPS